MNERWLCDLCHARSSCRRVHIDIDEFATGHCAQCRQVGDLIRCGLTHLTYPLPTTREIRSRFRIINGGKA